jgi:hypothetical protein
MTPFGPVVTVLLFVPVVWVGKLLWGLGRQICPHVHGLVQDGKNGRQNTIVGITLRHLGVEVFESLNQRVDQGWRVLRQISDLRVLQKTPQWLAIRN